MSHCAEVFFFCVFYPIRQSLASYLKLANDHLFPRAFPLFTIQCIGKYWMNCVSMNVTLSNIEWNISQWTLIQTNIGQLWMKHEQIERYPLRARTVYLVLDAWFTTASPHLTWTCSNQMHTATSKTCLNWIIGWVWRYDYLKTLCSASKQ